MKKIELIELLRHNLSGGDYTADMDMKYHENVISMWLEAIMADVENNIELKSKFNDLLQMNNNIKVYPTTGTVGIEVVYDPLRGKYYSMLPASVIGKTRGRGVVSVFPVGNESWEFFWEDNGSDRIYTELEVNQLDSRPRFNSPEGSRVYYRNMTSEIAMMGVCMRLNIGLSALEDEDEVNIPAGANQMVIDYIISRMRGMLPEDQANDNNSKQQ